MAKARRGYWMLQDAKARFSELVRRARSEGPQHVTVHGRDGVVIVSAEEFRRLQGNATGDVLIRAIQASRWRDTSLEPAPPANAGTRTVAGAGWLLDTSVISELQRPRPEPKVVAFVTSQPLDLLHVSIATLAEIRFGIELVAGLARRSELMDWLSHKVRPVFGQRALAISEDIMFRQRLMVEECRRSGHALSQPDLIIAATAQCHGLTVVSRDTAEYLKARVPVFSPWVEGLSGPTR